jgi:hypothetical protein
MPSPDGAATPLTEISGEGRIAGLTTAVIFVATAVVVLVAWWEPLWRRCGGIEGPCVRNAAAAGILTMGAIGALTSGVAMVLRIRRRPVEPDASSRYVWWLGALFALAVCVASWKIPSFTCERGRFDELLESCMHPRSRSEPARWIAFKNALITAALVGGALIALLPRWVRVTAPFTALTWFGVLGWVMTDELARRAGSS